MSHLPGPGPGPKPPAGDGEPKSRLAHRDKALLMERFKEWVAETPNTEALSLTEVLLLALLREMQRDEGRLYVDPSGHVASTKPPKGDGTGLKSGW